MSEIVGGTLGKTMKQTWALGCFVLSIFIGLCSCTPGKSMKAFYIPFDVQTYVPVTRDNIETMANYSVSIPESSETYRTVRSAFQNRGAGTIDGRMIRLKVVMYDVTVWADALGGAMDNDGRELEVSARILDEAMYTYVGGPSPE